MPALITTIGAADANSYVTEVEADAYFVGRFATGLGWDEFDSDQKTARLIYAARLMNVLVYVGTKNTVIQALQWPRANVFLDKLPEEYGVSNLGFYEYRDPFAYDNSAYGEGYPRAKNNGITAEDVPNDIKNAQIELALIVFEDDGSIAGLGSIEDGQFIKSEKIGSWSVGYGGSAGGQQVDQSVEPIAASREAVFFVYPYLEEHFDLYRR